MKWKIVCTSKEKGGLGIRCLGTFNKALLGKWNWRFSTEENPLWKKMISLKYGMEEGDWFSKNGRGYEVGYGKR